MSFLTDLGRAAKVRGIVVVGGAVSVFVLVQGWRLVSYLAATMLTAAGDMNGLERYFVTDKSNWLIAVCYLTMVAGNLLHGQLLHGQPSDRLLSIACLSVVGVQLLQISVVTGAMYGMMVSLGNLIPALGERSLVAPTLLATTVLLSGTLVSQRRVDH